MANNWEKWDELRRQRADLRGHHTSKEGLTALERKGIAVIPTHSWNKNPSVDQPDFTHLEHNGRYLGGIHHKSGAFSVYASNVRRMDEKGPFTSSHPLDVDDIRTHDAAIEALLREHNIEVSRPRSADRIASTVTGPAARSIVSRAYTGRRAAPAADMSTAKRTADSIATRIRMNSARTDPMTGEKLTASTRSADKIAHKVDKSITSSRLKSMYGKLLVVHRKKSGPSPTIDRHTTALTTSPEYHHRLVVNHMSGSPTGGIHIGDKSIVDMKGSYVHTAEQNGQQLVPDRTNAQLGGVYTSTHRQMVIPEDEGLSGSHSTASHEFGHALDHAYGNRLSGKDVFASQLPHFQQVYNEVGHMHDNSKTVLNPYYTSSSTGNGSKEMWAEGYAAWLHGRQQYRTPDEQAMLIGHELGAAPSEKLRVGRVLQNYFDIQDE